MKNSILAREDYTKNTYSCQYLIVGTGAGGSVAGALLAESGHDVIFLEEGGVASGAVSNCTMESDTGVLTTEERLMGLGQVILMVSLGTMMAAILLRREGQVSNLTELAPLILVGLVAVVILLGATSAVRYSLFGPGPIPAF